ncbi:MAG: FAD-dependent oxidoreductase [Bryobacteraceae bacterium]
MPSRRQFLSAGLVGLSAKTDRRIEGGFVLESQTLGHRLRDRLPFSASSQHRRIPLVIVGGGIAGLSAAWELDRRGFRDFVLVEMEATAGGNSRWGENDVSPYPWAAHYVPVPDRRTALVRELFEELGLMRGDECDERHLCHSPQERLFLHGRWQEGIEPAIGATARDTGQYRRFESLIQQHQASGQFTIPIDLGAKASPLDRISAAEWMRQQGFDSPYLRWYLDYACRDDYGASLEATSAWAAIHYFASREQEEHGPFTWPEGNGWIVKRLLTKLGRYLTTGAPVYRIDRTGHRFRIFTPSVEYLAEAVIFAAPTFLARYVVENAPVAEGFEYSPWLTANLTLDRLPRHRGGFEMAWDNVIYGSPSLGYVVATHQNLQSHSERTVWTYYWALAGRDPADARRWLLEAGWTSLKDAILNDLARAHPDIRQCVARVDVLKLGHAMIRPAVGFLFSESRRRIAASGKDRLFFANSDVSGISIFEEAQYRGVVAARRALRTLGRG